MEQETQRERDRQGLSHTQKHESQFVYSGERNIKENIV